MSTRKFESGSSKRKKKQRIEELIHSQKGGIHKFFVKEINSENVSDANVIAHVVVDATNVLDVNVNVPIVVDVSNVLDANIDVAIDNFDDTFVENLDANVDCIGTPIANVSAVENSDFVDDVENSNFDDDFEKIDIFDPRRWDSLDSKMIDILVEKGPKRDLSIEKGPKDKFSKRFLASWFTRVLPNGEKRDRDWFVYSKELDRVFCFCCKLFQKKGVRGQLADGGFSDWSHMISRFKEHETSLEHVKNMATWYDLRLILQKNQTIDKVAQKEFEKEQCHRRNVLLRIISMVKFLAKRNIAFRGSNEKLFENSNGNFLGLVEMLNEFDPVIQEHVHRITNDEIHHHYLGHKIQNGIILLLANSIKSKIIGKIKQAKYFSVILDCTPDISHQEQMSMILRYVNFSSNSISIEESFLGFLDVNDTTGLGLFDVMKDELKSLDLDIDNIRGQSYDNGSNMKGEHSGVQRRLLDINPRAFHTSCASHSLNLTLCDMANSCGKAKDFFGIIQRIYTIFSNSNKRWLILKDNVKQLTLKPLSSTRWESRVESVRAIRFQISEVREALLQVADVDLDPKIRSEANSLAQNELGDFEFIVSLVIWYEILHSTNLVSKHLQSKDMLIDDAILKISGLISFFKKYREDGFQKALEQAKEVCTTMDVDPIFPQKRVIKRKKHFDEVLESSSSNASLSREESFRVSYFLYVVDQAISSLTKRFEQYSSFESNFGFLFSSEKLFSLNDSCLKSSCMHIETILKSNDQSDIDGNDLYLELKLLQDLLPKECVLPFEVLNFLNRVDCFPNTSIVYRILLTIPVTVATAERSFSKLKLLKSYLRSTMTQERLNGLAMLAIEEKFLEDGEMEELIDNFISKNTRRLLRFKQ
ncbi:Zinc finger MYM-type protein 1 [Linum grandiflorum]